MADSIADPASDPRWHVLQAGTAVCPGCGDRHQGPFDIAFAAPAPRKGTGAQEPNSAIPHALADGRDILTGDFCRQGEHRFEHRFLRAVLVFPILGTGKEFASGVWGTLRRDLFSRMPDHVDSRALGRIGPCFSWLCNALPGCDPVPVRSRLMLADGTARPRLVIEDEGHPLFAAQEMGLTLADLFGICAHYGHRFDHAT